VRLQWFIACCDTGGIATLAAIRQISKHAADPYDRQNLFANIGVLYHQLNLFTGAIDLR
jgi:hypothetical protein